MPTAAGATPVARSIFACSVQVVLCLGLAGRAAPAAAPPDAAAREILEAAGVKGGLVVHLGCGDGRLTAALRAGESFLVQGLDADAKNVQAARRHVHSLGLDGRVTVARWTGNRLPYIDDLVRLLVCEDLGPVPMAEVRRVLAPGGVAYVRSGGQWTKTVKPRPGDIDEWTHYLHDAGGNAVAHDARVGPPRHMQWLARPLWTRNHHKLSSISAVVATAGRLFTIVDETTAASMEIPGRWLLVARDAFNGVTLWRRAISSWAWHGHGFRAGPVQLPRTLVAGADRLYAPLGLAAPVSALDAATGRTVRTYKGTENAEELVLHDGVLLVVTGSPAAEHAGIGPKGAAKVPFPNRKSIVALRADSGERLWTWSEPEGTYLMPLTLAAAGTRVFFQAGQGVVCLNRDTGQQAWRSPRAGGKQPAPAAAPRKAAKPGRTRKKRRSRAPRRLGWSVATLVVHDGVVLSADSGRLTAMAAGDGKALWDCPCKPGFRSPSDVFVAGGLLWLGPNFAEGRDLRTGRVKRSNATLGKLWTAGHHHRCYREKATDRYVMTGKRGIEFLDLAGENHSRNNWIRGVCQYGILPCNGLIYAPSHACGCYMEAKLYGFWALAAESPSRRVPSAAGSALEKGPAYGETAQRGSAIARGDWPTYRHDPQRSGSTATAPPAGLGGVWQTKVGGTLSAPVVAGGLVVVSSIDALRVVALDARDGTTRWSFAAGGRVDSPPTIHEGTVLFGCADGWVYCLRASDGEVAWRFRAAPEERWTVARDRVESLWPVHGSVLVEGGVAYVAAGRSSYLDGGIHLCGLDPATGKVVCRSGVRSRHPKGLEGSSDAPAEKFAQNAVDGKTLHAPDKSDAFSMDGGVTTDVLVGDGTSVYLRHRRFDRACVAQPTKGRHLFSTSRLVHDGEQHRSHWVLGTSDFSRIPVAYSWIVRNPARWPWRLSVPHGLMLTFDDRTVWGVRRSAKGGSYVLFAEENQPFSPEEKPLPDFRKSNRKAVGTFRWSADLAMRPRAMLRAGERVILAGMPGLTGRAESFPAFEGRRGGGLVWAMSTRDGGKLAEGKLPAPPVWDGLAAANGRLFVSRTDGVVSCLGAK